jgi:hypothetical protein
MLAALFCLALAALAWLIAWTLWPNSQTLALLLALLGGLAVLVALRALGGTA